MPRTLKTILEAEAQKVVLFQMGAKGGQRGASRSTALDQQIRTTGERRGRKKNGGLDRKRGRQREEEVRVLFRVKLYWS